MALLKPDADDNQHTEGNRDENENGADSAPGCDDSSRKEEGLGMALSRGKVQAVQSLLQRMQGGIQCRVNCTSYEAATIRNKEKCMSYMMKATKCMGEDVDELDNLDAHFMCHALESTTSGLAVLVATLAAGGVCPTSGERVLSSHVVKNCLSLMHTSGMGIMSGEFQFRIGVPSKCARGSGGGAILMAVPNVLGACYVPDMADATVTAATDGGGGHTHSDIRSARAEAGAARGGASGLPFCEGLVQRFAFHRHDTASDTAGNTNNADSVTDALKHGSGSSSRVDAAVPDVPKEDPTRRVVNWQCDRETPHGTSHSTSTPVVIRLLSAASVGDTMAIKAMHAAGVDLECADYDMRTAAHLAAATGHLEVLRYL